ncbi:MAG: CHAT domain-containing protein [Cyanobacteria bacterium J06649_5]
MTTLLSLLPAQAQSITAAADGTGTIIRQTGSQFTIEQGRLSGDAANLFHSFETFSLQAGERANFVSSPTVQNILTRVTGQSPSVINGQLQISANGAQPNLFFMNPAGVLFGPSATLNLPGNLTVTTADGIAFENTVEENRLNSNGLSWFNAVGENAYAAMTGAPSGDFAFLSDRPGSLLNEGSLTLREGKSLVLIGGTVVNVGGPSGDALTLVDVPGKGVVRLSQLGQVLSLELGAIAERVNSPLFEPLDLPTLLTSVPLGYASALVAHEDGTMRLTTADTPTVDTLTVDTPSPTDSANSKNPGSAGARAASHQAGSHQAGSHQAGSHQAGSHQAGNHQAGSYQASGGHVAMLAAESQRPQLDSRTGARDREGRDRTERDRTESDRITRDEDRGRSRRNSSEHRDRTSNTVNKFKSPRRLELGPVAANRLLTTLEEDGTQAFNRYFGRNLTSSEMSLSEVQQLLSEVERQSNNRSAVIYVKAPPPASPVPSSPSSPPAHSATDVSATDVSVTDSSVIKSDETVAGGLELLLVTATGNPIKIEVPVDRVELFETIEQFRSDLLTSVRRGGDPYLALAQQLHQWLIAPIEADLEAAQDIDTLVFSMDEGLRTLPVAALHDGQQFLVEKYSLGVVPSLGLVDTQYEPLAQAEVLAMGMSAFDELSPLPAVPWELDEIQSLWPGSSFLNEGFTRQNLVQQQARSPRQMIHLATHAEFTEGSADESYIQLWDEKLRLSELHRLGWQYPAVELLVLSACSTAIGSPEAEMGFAGLAVASGVRSAMASVWAVNDLGTLALMSEFYRQLKAAPVKAEALRQAQLALLNSDLSGRDGQLTNHHATRVFSLPPALASSRQTDFSHPYYWSGFTMIGSPW